MTPPDPKTRTSAKPINVGGVVFACYRVGILNHRWITGDGRLSVGHRFVHSATFNATVDGEGLGKRFRFQSTAMKAAVKAMRGNDKAAAAAAAKNKVTT